MHRVVRAMRAHAAYLKDREALDDSDDDDGPQNDDAWLFEDLKILGQLYSRLRDREQMIELVFEVSCAQTSSWLSILHSGTWQGFTSELLKDIITIFYSPLAQVYRAASIADSLGDTQNFINDLIKTVEQVDECEYLRLRLLDRADSKSVSQVDPHRTVNTFIELIHRHEQSFYHFVHKVHSKGESLFDGMMRWIELFLTLLREGIGPPISLEYLLPHSGQERAALMQEIDAVALYHYKLKVIYEDKLRRRFGRVQAGLKDNDADAEDEATQALMDRLAGEISFGELVKGDAADLAAQDTDDDSEEESTEDETSSSGESSGTSSGEIAPATRPGQMIARSQTLQNAATLPRRESFDSNERSDPLQSHSGLDFKGPDSSRQPLQSTRQTLQPLNLPPLPLLSKPLSSHPLTRPLSEPSPQLRSRPVPSPHARKNKKKAAETLKPPHLQHIPKLLPIFTEIVRLFTCKIPVDEFLPVAAPPSSTEMKQIYIYPAMI